MRFATAVIGGLVGVGLLAIAGPAQADMFVGTFKGNDCAGAFGKSFEECAIPSDPETYGAAAGSPIIIKFDFDGKTFTPTVNSSLFPTIDGTEFKLVLGDDKGTFGKWAYTPGPGDPIIRAYVAKGGDYFNVFLNDDTDMLSGSWTTPVACGKGDSEPCGLSHLSFYDSKGTVVPEPASLALLGAGLLGLGFALRRRRAA